jgi:uncharacterized protein YdeI (YjbR/CyaY-like superfamily)
MSRSDSYPVLELEDAAAWAAWLAANHDTIPGVWLRLAKKGTSLNSPGRADALDEALCWGWIDGQSRSLDEQSWLQKFTPRGRRSTWSKRNREHVERLMAEGRMREPGMAAVEAAKRDGRWDRAYDSPATATVPDDLRAALDADPVASEFFDSLAGANRYAVLYRVQTAIRPETRARRIRDLVAMLARRETIHP